MRIINKYYLFAVLLAIFAILSIRLTSQKEVSAATSTSEQRIRQLFTNIKAAEKTLALIPKVNNKSITVLSEKKTTTRIIAFDHELTDEEKTIIENQYNLTFAKRKSSKNRYIVTPKSETLLNELVKAKGILGVFNNESYTISAQSEDWGISNMRVETAWNYPTPMVGQDIVVAVLDTGIQLDHPDLVGAIQAGGYDFINDDNNPTDDHGHGTHVSGIIAATNNTDGYVGAAYGAKILPLKVCNPITGGTTCDAIAIVDAIDYAVTQNVDIINMSFGGGPNSLIQNSINNAVAAGVIVVASAGNNGTNACLYPAAYSNVVCVGAIDNTDAKAAFSNYGANLDIVAPGVDINSTYPGSNYATMSGTSMASPYYVGAAATVKSLLESFCVDTPSASYCTDMHLFIPSVIALMARDLGTPGVDDQFSNGAVDLSPLFVNTLGELGTVTPIIKKGVSYPQTATFMNSAEYAINLTSCSIYAKNQNRTQTSPALTITALNQGATEYTTPTTNALYTIFTFSTPIALAMNETLDFSYNYSPSTATQPTDIISTSFTCTFDNNATVPTVEAYRSGPIFATTKLDWPDTLRNVYFTFGKLRYGRYASPAQMRAGDMIYLKNYNPKYVKLLAISLYDYTIKGNQCYSRTWKTSVSMYMRTCNYLPTKRKYAFIFTFQDNATKVVIKKYFVVNTISPTTITY